MDTRQVESIVKTALYYTEEETPQRGYQEKNGWQFAYLCSLLLGGSGLYLAFSSSHLTQLALIGTLLGAIFGAYFHFFAPLRLPKYYDENRISFFSDGIFRMNLAGVAFNNSNWSHIVQWVRIWSCTATAACSYLSLLLYRLFPIQWHLAESVFLLMLLLGGLFLPLYRLGKKYA